MNRIYFGLLGASTTGHILTSRPESSLSVCPFLSALGLPCSPSCEHVTQLLVKPLANSPFDRAVGRGTTPG